MALEARPYVLRPLLHNVPLATDDAEDVKINCVDYLNQNLYVGTSASELLHFVQIPLDPNDPDGVAQFILASRLRPAYSDVAGTTPIGPKPGVQQILLLPRVGKACVLCNWTVTFYSLPELSPVFGTTQVRNCNWIGGVDLNEHGGGESQGQRSAGVTILLSLNRRIQVVRIGDDARVVKKIDFASSVLSVRRDNIACVADSRGYALLDVDRQLKIPLMSISSLDESQSGGQIGQAQKLTTASDGGLLRSASSVTTRSSHTFLNAPTGQAHSRSTSLGNLIAGSSRTQPKNLGEPDDPVFHDPDAPVPSPMRVKSPSVPNEGSNQAQQDMNKPLPAPPSDAAAGLFPQATSSGPARTASPARPGPVFLKPHIVSPTPEEFLLVTGTGPLDPGIGMFVNLDGDPSRPTLEFERYPREIVADGGSADFSSSRTSLGQDEEGYVLASMAKESDDDVHFGLEIQRFDVNVGEDDPEKSWLQIEPPTLPLGLRSLLQPDEVIFQEVVDRLSQQRFSPFARGLETSTHSLRSMDSRTALSIERQSKEKELYESDEEPLPEGWEASRIKDEKEFVRRLAKVSSRVAVWAGENIWWAVRNPLILQLDAGLHVADAPEKQSMSQNREERRQLFTILSSIRGRDAKTELKFMTFGYIRQKAGVMLLSSFLGSHGAPYSEPEMKAMEEVLLEGLLDPRVVLALIPVLRNEIVETRRGTWIYGGVKNVVDAYIASEKPSTGSQAVGSLSPEVLQFLRRFLTAWRKKKGFGSVADENEVFRTVDASLLLVLLELDKSSPKGPARAGSIRAELNEVVDRGVACFERAVDLLETYHRLYVLSRLYQSRKLAADVLATWRRIIEGEQDDGDELGDGEQRVRAYLANISNQALVQEYGIWLATRNPKLAVQVFADDKGKAPRFEHGRVVDMLRQEAPDAVKYYLEYLVFGKGNTVYVDELITYYLDVVVHDLQSSAQSRENVAATYEAYRALQPPKPTYRQFLTDNAPPDDEVWHSRLRLLQLLGGTTDYDVEAIAERVAPALRVGDHDGTKDPDARLLLVPEIIILDGRARRHERALRLLVHRLGDYDTAVSYCLRGGGSHGALANQKSSTPEKPAEPETLDRLQTRLFGVLLREFLTLDNVSDRVEQTSALLERFGGWFDILEVMQLVPDSWSVDVVAAFLEAALSRLVRERHEAAVARALSSAENLRVNGDWLDFLDEKKPVVVTGEGDYRVPGGGGITGGTEEGLL